MADSTAADEQWMRLALEQARAAAAAGEVPVGAVVVGEVGQDSVPVRDSESAPSERGPQARNGSQAGTPAPLDNAGVVPTADRAGPVPTIALGLGQNRTRRDGVVHAHAELVALGEAERRLGDFRLDNSVIYVTLEPCLMCLGAILQARVARIVYGAPEPKFGALVSRFPLQTHPLVARLGITGGVLADEAAALLTDFFRRLRGSA